VVDGTVGYLGQQVANFVEVAGDAKPIEGIGQICCPVYFYLQTGTWVDVSELLMQRTSRVEFVFSTYVGTLFLAVGRQCTVAGLLVFAMIAAAFFHTPMKQCPVTYALGIMLYYQMLFQGAFYLYADWSFWQWVRHLYGLHVYSHIPHTRQRSGQRHVIIGEWRQGNFNVHTDEHCLIADACSAHTRRWVGFVSQKYDVILHSSNPFSGKMPGVKIVTFRRFLVPAMPSRTVQWRARLRSRLLQASLAILYIRHPNMAFVASG
jgi:hypothetical protein